MNKISVSAPGKLMIMGEHAVVYNHSSISTAVDQRLFLTAEIINENKIVINAPDVEVSNYQKNLNELGQGDLPKGVKFIEIAVRNFNSKYKISQGLNISTSSEFSPLFGFGSSSASTVCIVKALSELFNYKLSNQELFDICYQTVLDIQGLGSGYDVATAIYGRTIYFVTGGKKIETLNVSTLPLIVGYSGVKADTATILKKVADNMKNYPEKINRIYEAIDKLVMEAKSVIEIGDWERLGTLFNFNQDYLRNLGVSTEILESMISEAKNAGAYGAKLSGAGGGDCMIALSTPENSKNVCDAINKSGGQVIEIATNAEGVRIEK